MKVDISIIIPVLNEALYINDCLESICVADFGKLSYEIIVIDGGSSDNTVSIVNQFCSMPIKIIHNPKAITPVSLNLGIQESSGTYICRLDAHSYYPKNYFIDLYNSSVKFNADNIGCLCKATTKENTFFSDAIKYVLNSPSGVGNSKFRIGTKTVVQVDTVPFGFFKASIFKKYGNFNESLVRNQDIEFNKRINNNGGTVLLNPNIEFIYCARSNLNDFLKNQFLNGFWNSKTVIITRSFSCLSLRHFIPFAFIVSLIFSLFLNITFFISLFTIHILYIVFSCRSHSFKNIAKFTLVNSLLHYTYGVGTLVGFLKRNARV